MIEILCISSDREQCGIREYSNYLQAHLPGDLTMRGNGRGEWLDPDRFFGELPAIREYQGPQVVWLNYHAALHSRWTALQVCQLRMKGIPVVITYHDTGVPNSEQCLKLYDIMQPALNAAPAKFIVHEPCADLPQAIYLRQGVPEWQPPPAVRIGAIGDPIPCNADWTWSLGLGNRPLLGTVGFPFPWKNYDLLAEATAEAGWSLLLIAPDQYHGGKPDQLASDIDRWRRLNPWTAVISDFLPASQVVSYLAACDATAFLYMCANTGTSGAIRQGIAARKPVLATAGCRQFRDLFEDPLGRVVINWVEDLSPTGVADYLAWLTPITRLAPGVHRLAERDSWTNQAEKYARIFREVTA